MSGRAPGLRNAGVRKAGDPGGGGGAGGGLVPGNNLSDLADAPTARGNLGLGTMATQYAAAVGITGGTITGLFPPTDPTDAATKGYVDAMVAGLSWKAPVRVATVFSGALGSAFGVGASIDGINLLAGDRILIQAQGTASENGIYVVQASGPPVRAADADTGAKLAGAAVFATDGVANHDRAFVQTTEVPIYPGITALTWVGFASALGAATQAYVDAGDNAVVAQLANYLPKSGNLAGLGNVATARTNLGLVALASSGLAADITDATAVGRSMLKAADQAAQTLLIAPATTALAGLLAAADKVKINGLAAIASSGLAADITDATAVGRSMLKAATQAAQTALIAVATTVLAGLMSAADKTKLDSQQILLDSQTLTAANTYTTPIWAANIYRKIVIDFVGKVNVATAGSNLLGLIVNADTGTNYETLGYANPAFLANAASWFGVLAYCKVGLWNLGSSASGAFRTVIEFYPETLGNVRQGTARSFGSSTVASAGSTELFAHVSWNNTATDVASLTIKTITPTDTLTGKVKVWGVPA